MGKVHFGAPPELCLRLRDAFGIDTFVETGTYKAGTAAWAAANFRQVYTVEAWEPYYRAASQSHRDKKNIEFLFGDSRTVLPEVLSKLDQPALIWLDAHWWGDSVVSAGTPGECPLREELAAIAACPVRHFILIDDLHCFQGQLNKGADRRLWPGVEEVHRLILAGHPDYAVADYEDIIIGVPPEARAVLADYVNHPGLRWLVPTSNKYLHFLNGFAYLFNKFVVPRQAVDIVRYDVRPPKLPANFQNVAVGAQSDYSWTAGMAAYLRLPQAPRHFILMLEDYWLCAPVDMARLDALWKYAQAHPEVGRIDLTADRMKVGHKDYPALDLVESAQDAAFRASLQASIWSREYLLGLCERGDWSPWQFEKHAAQGDGALVLGTKEPLIGYANAAGGMGKQPDKYDRKKIPPWMWDELRKARLV